MKLGTETGSAFNHIMAGAETAITWKDSGLAYMAFRGNKLVAGIRQDSGHRGEWLLSLPEPSGLFAVVRSFKTLKNAMRHVETSELGRSPSKS